MGTALVRGLVTAGWDPADVAVVEVSAERRVALAHELPGIAVHAEVVEAAGAVVAVKPAAAEDACRAAGPHRRRPCAVDHGGRAPGPAGVVAGAVGVGGAGHAQHPGHGGGRRVRHRGRVGGGGDRHGVGRVAAGCRGTRGAGAGGGARCRDRPVRFGPGLRLPRGRGARRGRGGRRAQPRDQPAARPRHRDGGGPAPPRHRARIPNDFGPRSPRPEARPRRVWPCSRSGACGLRWPPPWRRLPRGRASWGHDRGAPGAGVATRGGARFGLPRCPTRTWGGRGGGRGQGVRRRFLGPPLSSFTTVAYSRLRRERGDSTERR